MNNDGFIVKHFGCLEKRYINVTIIIIKTKMIGVIVVSSSSYLYVQISTFYTVPKKHHDFWTAQPLSPEEDLEKKLLLESIAWPETPPLPTPLSLMETSCPAKSSFTILPQSGDGQWHVGDKLKVLIKMYDFQGHPKKSGGDVLFARLHNLTLGAGVVGKVEDHLNGTYSAVFSLLWEGTVMLTLLHVLQRIKERSCNEVRLLQRIYQQSYCLSFFSGQVVVNSNNVESGPSGYYYHGAWQTLSGTKVQQFNTPSAITQCLKGKVVHLQGDSTIRQWFEYFSGALPGLKEFDLHSQKKIGPLMTVDIPNNILVTYRCHGPPIGFPDVPISELRYIANELDNVVGGTVVIIRTANPKALMLERTLTNNEWYTLQNDKVLRAIFKGLNVYLLDAWEMVLAHHLPHDIHPPPPIIKNMINVILSYICPMKGG
uniref:Neurexophilin and PC-esterase domain family member 3 n=1 Tax=Acanthochromis polyacanthus TaxID=80966 RepID=A0A3Q1FZW7_9TELE